jgi:hypothetical protein
VVIDSQPKDAPDGLLVVVTSTICPVSSAVPRLVLFPKQSGGKKMPGGLWPEGLWAESLYAEKDRSSPQWSSGLGREGQLSNLVIGRGSRAASRAVDMAAKSEGRHKVGSRTGLERPMTARYGRVLVKI